MYDIDHVGVFLGLDVAKSAHHGCALTPASKKGFDRQLPNSEQKSRAAFDKLAAKFGPVLVIVDQPASIGALPLTVARDASCKVVHLLLGPRLDHPAVTWLPESYGSPATLRKASRRKLIEVIRPKAPRMVQRLIDEVFDTLDEQTVVVPSPGR